MVPLWLTHSLTAEIIIWQTRSNLQNILRSVSWTGLSHKLWGWTWIQPRHWGSRFIIIIFLFYNLLVVKTEFDIIQSESLLILLVAQAWFCAHCAQLASRWMLEQSCEMWRLKSMKKSRAEERRIIFDFLVWLKKIVTSSLAVSPSTFY